MSKGPSNILVARNMNINNHGNGDSVKQATHVIHDLNDKRDHEIQKLQSLNKRFSTYVERVRNLEATNRNLLADINDLKAKCSLNASKTKGTREPDLLKFREDIDDLARQKAIANTKAKRALTDAEDIKNSMEIALASFNADQKKKEDLERQLANTKQDTEYYRIQVDDINQQIAKYVNEQRKYMDQYQQLKDNLDRETIERESLQYEVQTIEEQIAFLKAIQEEELSEISRLQADSSFDPSRFYRNELEKALRDIRSDFDELNNVQKHELEDRYQIKLDEAEKEANLEKEPTKMTSLEDINDLKKTLSDLAREYSDLKKQNVDLGMRFNGLKELLDKLKQKNKTDMAEREQEIANLRDKIKDLMLTNDQVLGQKNSLVFEISTYNRLLEGEEKREKVLSDASSTALLASLSKLSTLPARPIAAPSNINSSQITQRRPSFQRNIETMKRMQVQRECKGQVAIKEISPDGRYIIIENTGKTGDIDIGKWQIRRKVDNEPEISYTFPAYTKLSSGSTIKIWSRGQGKAANPPNELLLSGYDVPEATDEFVHNQDWKTGNEMVTRLFNQHGKEKALYSQKPI